MAPLRQMLPVSVCSYQLTSVVLSEKKLLAICPTYKKILETTFCAIHGAGKFCCGQAEQAFALSEAYSPS